MNSSLLNNQEAGLASIPFTSQSKTQGSTTGATFRDVCMQVGMQVGR